MKSIYIGIGFTFLTSINLLLSQTIIRASVGSIGLTGKSERLIIQQTVGQPYQTTTKYNNQLDFRPGFIQPNQIYVEFLKSNIEVEINVYPNPATSNVSFNSIANLEDLTLVVLDQSGKIVHQESARNLNQLSLNCSSWTTGNYFITISDQFGKSNQLKLIKQ
jgi:hypothetical protein